MMDVEFHRHMGGTHDYKSLYILGKYIRYVEVSSAHARGGHVVVSWAAAPLAHSTPPPPTPPTPGTQDAPPPPYTACRAACVDATPVLPIVWSRSLRTSTCWRRSKQG